MMDNDTSANTIPGPFKFDDMRIVALNTSPWPMDLFEDFEGGRDDINVPINQGEEDRLFGTRIREAIKVLRGQR